MHSLAYGAQPDNVTLQARDVKQVSDYVAQLRRVSDGHGMWHFDQILQQDAMKLATPSVSSVPA